MERVAAQQQTGGVGCGVFFAIAMLLKGTPLQNCAYRPEKDEKASCHLSGEERVYSISNATHQEENEVGKGQKHSHSFLLCI